MTRIRRLRWLAFAWTLYAPLAPAQVKWIDSNGRVGYGDKPPPGAHDIEPLQGVAKGETLDPIDRLPFALRQTIRDFPITLYTTEACPACDKGRAWLKERALPFSERSVLGAQGAQALLKMAGTDRLPVLQVGRQFVKGLNTGLWQSALDVAGYPHENLLPARWTWPDARPLIDTAPPPPTEPAEARP